MPGNWPFMQRKYAYGYAFEMGFCVYGLIHHQSDNLCEVRTALATYISIVLLSCLKCLSVNYCDEFACGL